MLIKDNLLSQEEISDFIKYYNESFKNKDIESLDFEETELNTKLSLNKNPKLMDILKKIVFEITPDFKDITALYQRQTFPLNIHVDDYLESSPFVYTMILALDSSPEFKTIVWNEKYNNNKEFKKFLFKFNDKVKKIDKITNISNYEDLEHTLKLHDTYYFCDYLTLDGIFSYKSGSCVLFDARKLHCSSNWVKYKNYSYKDLVVLHFSTETFYDF